MNIVFFRYRSICEPDIIDAFKQLQIKVVEDMSFCDNADSDTQTRIEYLMGVISSNNPVFVFSINFFPVLSMVCERLGILYVALSVDCPVLELYTESIKNRCNRIFLFDYNQYLSVSAYNSTGVFYMALGSSVARYDNQMGEFTGNDNYLYDISFVGSLYSEKNPYEHLILPERIRGYCDGVIASQLQVNGVELLEKSVGKDLIEAFKESNVSHMNLGGMVDNMDSFVIINEYLCHEIASVERKKLLNSLARATTDNAGLDKEIKVHLFTASDTSQLNGVVCHPPVESIVEMPTVFRKSKINLNTNLRSIQTGLPQRIWDVMGSGGFLLTSYEAELPEYFEIGTHVEAFESIKEAEEKAIYYLQHEEERLQIALNGYNLVKEKHTVLQRVIYMINTICGQ